MNQQPAGPDPLPSALEVARYYAAGESGARPIDEWLGTPQTTRPVPSGQLRQAASDTVRYLEFRPVDAQSTPSPDAHYEATMGPPDPDKTKRAADLVDEWAVAEARDDYTRVQDIREELNRRTERRSLNSKGRPYVRPNIDQARPPAYSMQTLFERKDRLVRQQSSASPPAPGQLPTPTATPPPPTSGGQPKPPGVWQRANLRAGNFLHNPDHPRRTAWLAAGTVALGLVGGIAAAYVAARRGMHISPPGAVFPWHLPDLGAGVDSAQQVPAVEPAQIDPLQAGAAETVWEAKQQQYPNFSDAQIRQALLGDFATLKSRGWQGELWVDPNNPNLWGFSDTFTAPKDQYLYFTDGRIEHLDGQTYSGTGGTYAALEYADAYGRARVVPGFDMADPQGIPVGASQLPVQNQAYVPKEGSATTLAEVPPAGQSIPSVLTAQSLSALAFSRAWEEELRRRLAKEEDED